MVAEDDETSKDKEIDKLMALISLSFKKIYKPTNNNLRTSSNTSRANQDNSPRINKSAGIQCYNCKEFGHVVRERQKPKRVKDAAYHREKMLLCMQEEARIQLNVKQANWRDDTDDDELKDQELEAYYMYMAQLQEVAPDAADSGPIFDAEPLQKVLNDDHYNVFAIKSAHPEQSKYVHDTYPIEQDAHNVIIHSLDMSYDREEIGRNDDDNDLANEQQANWRDDTDDKELEDQELEAHYMYMAQLQEVSLDATDSGPIFDAEPLQNVSHDNRYNVFAIESEHPEQSGSIHATYPIEQDAHNVIIDSLDMSYNREEIDQNDDDNDLANERELLASLIEKLKCEIDESKNRNKFLETSNKKEAQTKLYRTREDKELDKVIALENKVKILDNIMYKTGQSVQTMNMLNNKCRTSFAKPEFLKKAQRANPRLYDICCYNDNLALMLAPESDEVIRLEKESRLKLSDLIRPFDYNKLNNLYDLFVPQCEKSSEQIYFQKDQDCSYIC
nr:hypothetical protein [Tanacetum cinerariifolium]